MKFYQICWLLVLGGLLVACGGEDPLSPEAFDGPDDSFLASGKADTGGIAENSPDAVAILKLASTASLADLKDSNEVDLWSASADAIEAYRTNKGAAFDTLKELDSVKYVGPVAFWKMLAYVQSKGLVASGGTKIYKEGDPAQLGSYSYVLHDSLLLKEYEQTIGNNHNTFVVWQLHVKADFLAVDAKNNKLVAFGASKLYIINPTGYVEKTFDQGYDDIPDLKGQLLSGSAVCVVYKNLASYYQGRSLGAYMVGNVWAGSWYNWWRYYFEGLYAFTGCSS